MLLWRRLWRARWRREKRRQSHKRWRNGWRCTEAEPCLLWVQLLSSSWPSSTARNDLKHPFIYKLKYPTLQLILRIILFPLMKRVSCWLFQNLVLDKLFQHPRSNLWLDLSTLHKNNLIISSRTDISTFRHAEFSRKIVSHHQSAARKSDCWRTIDQDCSSGLKFRPFGTCLQCIWRKKSWGLARWQSRQHRGSW